VTLPLQKLPQALLIVDDRDEVLRALQRYMALYFSSVFVAKTPPEAEALLAEHSPALLLCDYWLGEAYPPSTGFIPAWRKRFTSLRRVVLMSGTKSSSIPPCAEIDEVFQKPLDMKRLVEFFTM
jgi:DNA-binding NtrC family response regulator